MTPHPIQEEITQVEQEMSNERHNIIDNEVIANVVDWVPNVGNTRGRHNQYMYTMDIYWDIKFNLDRVMVSHNENDAIQSLNQV